MAITSSTTKSIVKKKPSSSTASLQPSNNSSDKYDGRISKSEISGCSNKRKDDQVAPLVPDDGDKKQRPMDPSMRWKLMEQRWKRRKTGALKTSHVQPNKKQGPMMMISVSSGSNSGTKKTADHQDSIKAADHQDSIKAKLSQGGGQISKPAGGIEKINNAPENTCPNSSSSRDLSGDLVCCVNKIRKVDDEQVLKKALQAAMQTSRFAEIVSKSKANKADLQKERERQKRRQQEEEEARKAAQIREAEQLKKKETTELREKQREAARIALQMVEKTVELEDNLMILKELEMLSQCSSTYILQHGRSGPAVMVLKGLQTGEVLHPLEQLGLHLKEEFMADDDDEDTILSWEAEEGEILHTKY